MNSVWEETCSQQQLSPQASPLAGAALDEGSGSARPSRRGRRSGRGRVLRMRASLRQRLVPGWGGGVG